MARARLALNRGHGLPVNAPRAWSTSATRPWCPPVEAGARGHLDDNPLIVARLEEQQRAGETVTSWNAAASRVSAAEAAIEWTSSAIIQPTGCRHPLRRSFSWISYGLAPRVGNRRGKSGAAERNRIGHGSDMRASTRRLGPTGSVRAERLAAYDTARRPYARKENLRIR